METFKKKMEMSEFPIVETMSVMDAIKSAINDRTFGDESFFVANLADVLEKYKKWEKMLPRVHPFYAVKCNSDSFLLQIMASLGICFDCASKDEIRSVLKAGAKPEDIIYAHPFKSLEYIRYAQSKRVDLMTFDCKSELLKIKSTYPDARLVIRLRTPNAPAGFPLNKKFGCDIAQIYQLLNFAYQLHMNVVGVSFHVGSLCLDAAAYARAIGLARKVFDMAEEIGLDFKLLDIGGGFPGHTGSSELFDKICYYINQGLDEYFPLEKTHNIDVIAEPGCYFVCSSHTLCTKIIGKKEVGVDDPNEDDGSKAVKVMYYLNDGVNGAFSEGIEKYFNRVRPLLKRSEAMERPRKFSKLWGITCCSGDSIMEQCLLPEMEVGEYILFENMGAYTSAMASTFNGFPKASTRYTYSPIEKTDRSSQLPIAFASSTLSTYDKKPDSICDDDSNSDLRRLG